MPCPSGSITTRLVQATGITAHRAPQGLAMTLCILTLCAIVPSIGILPALINLVLLPILFASAITGINALAAATGGSSTFAPGPQSGAGFGSTGG